MSLETVKITTICENSAGSRYLLGEHGLALLLEVEDQKILFDTGAGLTLTNNAQALGIDLNDLDAVILSHGHFDHTGGLLSLLKHVDEVPVYAHPKIFEAKHRLADKNELKHIGIPCSKQDLENKGANFYLNREATNLGHRIMLSGEIPQTVQNPGADQHFFIKTFSGVVKDPLQDDQAVIIDAPQGLIVVLGCAHAGIINTLYHAIQITGNKMIHTVLGGTHMMNLSFSQINSIVEQLHHFGLQQIAPCHCTGMKARFALYSAFGERFLEHRTGSIFIF